MKSKANKAWIEEFDEELLALLELIKRQAEIDKKLQALVVTAASVPGE